MNAVEPFQSISLDLFVFSFRERLSSGEFQCYVCGFRERFPALNLPEALNHIVRHFRRSAASHPNSEAEYVGTLVENFDSDPLFINTKTRECSFEAVPPLSDAELAVLVRQRLFDHAKAVDGDDAEPPGTRTAMLVKFLLGRLNESGLLAPMLAEFAEDPAVPLRPVMQELDDIEEHLNG